MELMEQNKMLSNGYMTIEENKEKIEWHKAQRPTKINRLALHMMMGNAVTGIEMARLFNIRSYRDVIYDLRKKYDITGKVITHKGGDSHVVWWLSCFEENFVKSRNPRLFY